jgi:integrase
LRDITPQTAQDYAAALIQSKISPNTYNKHTSFLCLFFHVLKTPARMTENPFDLVPSHDGKGNTRRELTIAELKDILEKAKGELQTLLYVGTFTGLRLGDCCTLKWGEVDLDRGMLRRIPNKTAKSGKPVLIGIPSALAAKLAEIPKSRRKGYVVPKFAALYNYRSADGRPTRQPDISNEIQAHFTACGIQTTKDGTGKEAHAEAVKQWEAAGRKGQKPVYKRAVVEVGFHSLRHTWVSLHAAAGTPQGVIQDVIGHANPAMTAHYTHVNEETARRTAGAWQLNEPKATRAPLPDWARNLIEGMTAKNLKTRKKQLLAEPKNGKE